MQRRNKDTLAMGKNIFHERNRWKKRDLGNNPLSPTHKSIKFIIQDQEQKQYQ